MLPIPWNLLCLCISRFPHFPVPDLHGRDRRKIPSVLLRFFFTLCSLLFDLSRFNARWIFHHAAGSGRVRIGRIPSPGDTRTASRLCTVSSLVPSAFENTHSFSFSLSLLALFPPSSHHFIVSFLLESIRCHRLEKYRGTRGAVNTFAAYVVSKLLVECRNNPTGTLRHFQVPSCETNLEDENPSGLFKSFNIPSNFSPTLTALFL